MLYWLLWEKLYHYFSPFRVFQYNTFRTAFASLTALFLSILLGPWLIRKLREFQIGQHIREEGPKSHFTKAGTPTMGGLLIVMAVAVSTLLWANLRNYYVWIAMFGMVGFGAVGFYDDYMKVRRMRNLGLTARMKILLQVIVSLIIGFILLGLHAQERVLHGDERSVLQTVEAGPPDLGLVEQRVDLSAGVRRLLRLRCVHPCGRFECRKSHGWVGRPRDRIDDHCRGGDDDARLVTGHARFADYLELARQPGASELTIFCASLTGASIGFLWYNAHPAEIFMGDVGSLALGGSLGTIAVLLKQEILLVFIGGVYVLEAVSVILQVGSYKLRGKRIFKMAPLHHHFEALGWQEAKIITRFWIAGLVMALFALTTLKLR